MITGIHHLSLIASSRKIILFYENLGFLVKKEMIRSYDTVVLMEGYGIGLELFINSSHPREKLQNLSGCAASLSRLTISRMQPRSGVLIQTRSELTGLEKSILT